MNPGELRETTQCVVCMNNMDTHAYCGPGSVVIDSCHHCGLIWLDKRELKRIVEAPGNRELLATDLIDFDSQDPNVGPRQNLEATIFDSHVAGVTAWLFM